MKLRSAILGLLMASVAIASLEYAPSMNALPAYSPCAYTVSWTWVNEGSMKDNYYPDGCSEYPCFIYYEIAQQKDGVVIATQYVHPSSNKSLGIVCDGDARYNYRVRAWYASYSDDPLTSAVYTEWSNTVSTIVDSAPPALTLAYPSDGYTRTEGESVYIYAYAGDVNGISNISFYVNGAVDNSTAGTYLAYSKKFAPGTYSFFATAKDGAGLLARVPAEGTYSFTVLSASTVPAACSDGTAYSSCSITKPLYCSAGTLVNNCTSCGCTLGYSCNSTSSICYLPEEANVQACSDGTAYGACSITKPKYCLDGQLINMCGICWCPDGQKCVDNVCLAQASTCGNSICETGEGSSCCRDCGCPSGKLCNATSDLCYYPPSPQEYITLRMTFPESANLVYSPGQNAKFILQVTDKSRRPVNDSVILVYSQEGDYTSANLGNGAYEVTYRIAIGANDSFPLSMTAKRGEQISQALSLIIGIDRALDMELLEPAQDNISESQEIEVKIAYPDGSPVLDGKFKMTLGDSTVYLARSGDTYHALLNLSGQDYGSKSISFTGLDSYNNQLDRLLVINYIEKKDYSPYLVAMLLLVGGSTAGYFIYSWSSTVRNDYAGLKKERDYLIVMDKRTHLEFFKRHIDENTFKKLALEYQQKLKDVESVANAMEKKHRWLKWIGG